MYVNTIVFKGRWKQQFNTSLTRQGAFFPAPRQHINVPMMTIEGLFRTITISKFRYYGDNLKVRLKRVIIILVILRSMCVYCLTNGKEHDIVIE